MLKKYSHSIFYIVVLIVFSTLIYWVAIKGKQLEVDVNRIVSDKSHWIEFLSSMTTNLKLPLALLLAQIVTIVLVARILGWFFRKIGQPSVIGEIIAGILLGPSFFGMFFPEMSGTLFPVESLGNLQILSQIGLILFMFVIGMELDLGVLKNKAADAVVISHASIIFPFSLGMGLAFFIYKTFAPAGVDFLSFALFMGIAMSITAFPVLARIVQERGIHKTRLGTIVLTCAAADDITAWCLLATVIAIVKAGSIVSSLYVVALAVLYVFVMLKLVRPFLKRIADLHPTSESLSKGVVAIFLLTLIISAYLTEIIGIHALFGAFLAGAIMPVNSKFRHVFIQKVEDLAVVLFLPLFFVYTGLRTEIGLLNDISLWKITGCIILVAVIGKFVGSAVAARFVGQSWKESLIIGTLMNTRGLMELVVLNIGYDLGILGPEIFAMMVIMALVTTFMTGPLLDLINWFYRSKESTDIEEVMTLGKYKILFSFKNNENSTVLLRLANALVKQQPENTIVTALHLVQSDETYSFDDATYEEQVYAPVVEAAKELNQPIVTLFKVANNADDEIIEIANKGTYDLLLIGIRQSIFDGTLLGKLLGFTTRIVNPDRLIDKLSGKEGLFENSPFDERTRSIMNGVKLPVGVYVDKGNEKFDTVFIPILSNNDTFLVEFAQRLIHNNDSQVVIYDVADFVKKSFTIKELVRSIEQVKPNHIIIKSDKTMKKEFLDSQDMMLISVESWKKLIESRSPWVDNIPSTLIIKKGG